MKNWKGNALITIYHNKIMANIYKKKPKKFDKNSRHASFGIKNWLISKNLCVKEGSKHCINIKEYGEFLSMYLTKYPPKKELKNREQVENYIQNEFPRFCNFAINLINK